MKIYNKLVRDRIPEIIEGDNKQCQIEILEDGRYRAMLDEKLDEECAEYQESKDIEELADMLEVMYAIAKTRGYSSEDLERIRREKAEKRGGFEKKILLKAVREK